MNKMKITNNKGNVNSCLKANEKKTIKIIRINKINIANNKDKTSSCLKASDAFAFILYDMSFI